MIRAHHLVDSLRRCCSILESNERKICQRIVAIAKVWHNLGWVGAVCEHVQQRHVGHEIEPRENLQEKGRRQQGLRDLVKTSSVKTVYPRGSTWQRYVSVCVKTPQ